MTGPKPPRRTRKRRTLGTLQRLLLMIAAAYPAQLEAQPAAGESPAAAVPGNATTAPQGPPKPAPDVVTRLSERRLSIRDLPAPRRFVTDHETTIRGQRLRYTATSGETYITNLFGEPTASIFSFAYIKGDPPNPSRPVMFVFNGGPGSSSLWLHMGVIGPRRVVLDQEVNPSNTPPFGLRDNPYSPLDITDLVFVDPVGTGFSHAVGNARNSDFFGVDEDADAIARFIELWLTENGRWNSPKYLMGESYGATRAAILPRALMGGPFYTGVMRGITVNGVVLVSPAMGFGVPGQASAAPDLAVGRFLPTMAVTAWYHNRIDRAGRSAAQIYEEAKQFATSEYAQAIQRLEQRSLPDAERDRIATRLAAVTGIPATEWIQHNLQIPPQRFRRTVLADRGMEAGDYDTRYTLTLAGSGNDPVADDPAMGRYVPGFIAAFHQMLRNELRVDLPVPYNAITFAEVNFGWNWKRLPVAAGSHPAQDLAIAMRRTPAMRVLVATGYYDMNSTPVSAEMQLQRGDLPIERVWIRNYQSGHMLYLGDTAESFANDVRALITSRSASE